MRSDLRDPDRVMEIGIVTADAGKGDGRITDNTAEKVLAWVAES